MHNIKYYLIFFIYLAIQSNAFSVAPLPDDHINDSEINRATEENTSKNSTQKKRLLECSEKEKLERLIEINKEWITIAKEVRGKEHKTKICWDKKPSKKTEPNSKSTTNEPLKPIIATKHDSNNLNINLKSNQQHSDSNYKYYIPVSIASIISIAYDYYSFRPTQKRLKKKDQIKPIKLDTETEVLIKKENSKESKITSKIIAQ